MMELLSSEFLFRALLAGMGIAALSGPLGSFVVWRRLAFLGDTLSHASLLGVALAFFFHLQWYVGIMAVVGLIAIAMVLLQRDQTMSTDSILAILAHGSLAVGLLVISTLKSTRIDLFGLLFGDILSVSWSDVAFIYVLGILILMALFFMWQTLLSASVHEELAEVEGRHIIRYKLAFSLLLAFWIAVTMKLVGALLITALLIIPPTTARIFAKSPEGMAWGGSVVGMLAVTFGFIASFQWDLPTGPSVVTAGLIMFFLSMVGMRLRKD